MKTMKTMKTILLLTLIILSTISCNTKNNKTKFCLENSFCDSIIIEKINKEQYKISSSKWTLPALKKENFYEVTYEGKNYTLIEEENSLTLDNIKFKKLKSDFLKFNKDETFYLNNCNQNNEIDLTLYYSHKDKDLAFNIAGFTYYFSIKLEDNLYKMYFKNVTNVHENAPGWEGIGEACELRKKNINKSKVVAEIKFIADNLIKLHWKTIEFNNSKLDDFEGLHYLNREYENLYLMSKF